LSRDKPAAVILLVGSALLISFVSGRCMPWTGGFETEECVDHGKALLAWAAKYLKLADTANTIRTRSGAAFAHIPRVYRASERHLLSPLQAGMVCPSRSSGDFDRQSGRCPDGVWSARGQTIPPCNGRHRCARSTTPAPQVAREWIALSDR